MTDDDSPDPAPPWPIDGRTAPTAVRRGSVVVRSIAPGVTAE